MNKENIESLVNEEETISDDELRAVFNAYWKDIVVTDGKIDIVKVVKELHDYYYLLKYVSQVYDRLTGGRVVMPLTYPNVVIDVIKSIQNQQVEEEFKIAKDAFIDFMFDAGYFDIYGGKKEQLKQELQKVVWKINRNQTSHSPL